MSKRGPGRRVGAVVVGIREDKVLLLHRLNPERWELPGGGVEDDESTRHAAMREFEEETGLCTLNIRFIGYVDNNDNGDGLAWTTLFFKAEVSAGDPRITEPDKHDKAGWFSLENLPLNLRPGALTGIHLATGMYPHATQRNPGLGRPERPHTVGHQPDH